MPDNICELFDDAMNEWMIEEVRRIVKDRDENSLAFLISPPLPELSSIIDNLKLMPMAEFINHLNSCNEKVLELIKISEEKLIKYNRRTFLSKLFGKECRCKKELRIFGEHVVEINKFIRMASNTKKKRAYVDSRFMSQLANVEDLYADIHPSMSMGPYR